MTSCFDKLGPATCPAVSPRVSYGFEWKVFEVRLDEMSRYLYLAFLTPFTRGWPYAFPSVGLAYPSSTAIPSFLSTMTASPRLLLQLSASLQSVTVNMAACRIEWPLAIPQPFVFCCAMQSPTDGIFEWRCFTVPKAVSLSRNDWTGADSRWYRGALKNSLRSVLTTPPGLLRLIIFSPSCETQFHGISIIERNEMVPRSHITLEHLVNRLLRTLYQNMMHPFQSGNYRNYCTMTHNNLPAYSTWENTETAIKICLDAKQKTTTAIQLPPLPKWRYLIYVV